MHINRNTLLELNQASDQPAIARCRQVKGSRGSWHEVVLIQPSHLAMSGGATGSVGAVASVAMLREAERLEPRGVEIEQWAHEHDLPYFDGRCISQTVASSSRMSDRSRCERLARVGPRIWDVLDVEHLGGAHVRGTTALI